MQIRPYLTNAAWNPKDISEDTSWVYEISNVEQGELKAALAQFKRWVEENHMQVEVDSGQLLPSPENFPLRTLGPHLRDTQQALEEGYGIALYRNFPTDLNESDSKLMYGGMISYIGTSQPQTVRKELLQPVQDEGQAKLDERRGSKHNMGLPVHNDGCDVAGFLCRRTPLEGGRTILVSAVSVHNAMLEAHPDLVEELYRPMHHSWQDYQFPGGINSVEAAEETGLSRTWFAPVFSQKSDKLCVRYSRFYTNRAQTYDDIPRLSDKQIAALDVFDSYINDEKNWQYRRDFELGDVLLINNHELFHSRTEFFNGESISDQRQLIRAWMAVPNSRPLSPQMACFFGNTEAGSFRGGVKKQFIEVAEKFNYFN